VVLLADGEIGALGELATVEGLADKNHHAVELNLNPQLDAVQESGLLGEEILVQDGESGGIISVRVQVLRGSVERGLTVGGEGVLGAFEIVGGGDALEIGGETLVTTGGVPGGDVLAESSKAGAFGVGGLRGDPDGVDVVATGGGDGVDAEIVVGEGQIATLHGRGEVHGVGEAGAEHGVHLGGDILDALEGLELRGESAEVAKGRVGKTGGGQDVGERDIQLVGHILVVGQDPAGKIANLGGGALVDRGESVNVQLGISLHLSLLEATRGGHGEELARGAIAVGGNAGGERSDKQFHHLERVI